MGCARMSRGSACIRFIHSGIDRGRELPHQGRRKSDQRTQVMKTRIMLSLPLLAIALPAAAQEVNVYS
ncbi:MAG: hypothetical protein KDE17_12285, partial [Rhodobacteraceae bacterium]|nr:hypothetical protein [Paracoccaceae bacterium]